MTELSDELLVAYVDGQLAREQTRAVEKVLEQDDVVAARVDALKAAHGRFESAFAAILACEMSEVMAAEPMVPRPASREGGNGLVKVGLATVGTGLALAALVAGYGWPLVVPDLMREPSPSPQQQQQAMVAPPSWQEQAARAHALLSRATVEIGLENQGNRDLVAFQIAQAIGPAVRLPDLETQGLKFMRAQLLRFGDKPLAQMLYLGAEKNPLALYAMRGGGGDSRLVFRQEGAVGTVSWHSEGIAYLLAGEDGEAALLRLAEKIRSEPAAPGIVPPPRPEPQATQAPAAPAPPANATASAPMVSDPAVTGSTPGARQASPTPLPPAH
jgi:anti-sigma factor RsiW